MAAISWKYNTDGLWANAANWSGGVLPGAADDVTLATLTYHTISFTTGTAEIHSLTATTDSLNVSSGTLSILATASFGQNLTVSGGSLGLLGAASVTGTFDGVSGQVTLGTGTDLALHGSINFDSDTLGTTGPHMDGAGTLSTLGTTNIAQSLYGDYTALILGGGITWDIGATVLDAGQILTGDGSGLTAAFVNAAGLSFDLTTDTAGILAGSAQNAQNQTIYGSSTFSNAGTFAKTGGTLTSHVDSLFTNTGVVTAASGTLEFDGGGSFGGTLSGAGQIAFGGGSATLSVAASALSVASLQIDGGTLTIADPLNYAGSLTLSAGTLILGGASNTIGAYSQYTYDYLDLNGSSVSIANGYFGAGYVEGGGTLTTSGTTTLAGWNNYVYEAGGNMDWVNTGTLDQNYYFYVDSGSGGGFSFTNTAGATYDMTGDFALGANNSGTVGSTFTNAGTFAKTVGTNTNSIVSTFTNTGTIDAATGTIEFDSGGVFGGSLAGTGTVSFAGGSATLSSGISVQVANLLLDGATLTLGGNLNLAAVGVTEVSGRLDLGGHTLSVANGYFGNGFLDGPGTLTTTGTTNVSGYNGGYMQVGGGLAWTNDGVINLNNTLYVDYVSGAAFTITNAHGASFNIFGNFPVGANNYNGIESVFINQGTFTKEAGTGTTQVFSEFTNTGTISVQQGNLEFDGGGILGGRITGSGTFSMATGTYTLSAGAVSTAAEFLLDGGTLTLGGNFSQTSSQVTLINGLLSLGGFALSLGGADLGGGTIEGPGSITTSGTDTLGGFYGDYTLYLGGGLSWTNSGTIDQNYNVQDATAGTNFTITNKAGATWDLTNNYTLGGNNNSSITSTFVNAGLFESNGGTNTSVVDSLFTNTGTVSVVTGGLEFTDGGIFGGSLAGTGALSLNYAAYTLSGLSTAGTSSLYFYQSAIAAGGTDTIGGLFYVQSTTLTLSAGSTLSISGSLAVNVAGQGLPVDGPGTLITGGAVGIVDWYSNGVMLSVGGGALWQNSGTVTAGGIVQLGDTDLVNGTAAGTLINTATGVFDFTSDDAAIYQGQYFNGYGQAVSSGGSLVNAGLLEKTAGTLVSRIYAVLDSTGTLATTSGTIGLYGGGAISGAIADASNILFGSGFFSDGALAIGGGAAVGNSATIDATGSLTLGDSTSAASSFSNSGTYLLDGNVGILAAGTAGSDFTNTGIFEKSTGTGDSLVGAAVINSGTIIAGSGTLSLTGSVTGTGTLLIAAGATLELGAGIAASQTVSFTAPSETLLLDSPSAAPAETVAGLTIGDTIVFDGLTATKVSVSATDLLQVYDNTTVVAKLQLAGSFVGDAFTVTSNSSGATVTLTSAVSAWKGVSADWYATNVWTNGPPTAQTNASVTLSGAYTLTLNYGETGVVNTLALKAPSATYSIGGTLDVTTSITVSAGALQLTGTINGGILDNAGGGSITYGSNALLNNVAYQGLLDLSENYADLHLTGAFSLAGAGGKGAATISLTGYNAVLYVGGDETLTNATLDIGNSGGGGSYLESTDPNGQGAILTLGSALSIVHTGTNAELYDANTGFDAIYNDGKITAALAAGIFTIAGNDFENDGTIAVGNGDTFDINSAQFVNTGSLAVSSATLGISGSYENTGSVTATKSVLNFGTSLTGSQLAAITAGGGDTLNLSGTLTATGDTLAVGGSAKIVALALSGEILGGTIDPVAGAFTFLNGSTLDNVTYNGTMSVGSGVAVTLDGVIGNAVIADSGGGILFGAGAELNKVSYQGTMTLQPGNTVSVAGGLTLAGTGGTGAGEIDAVAGATSSVLYFLDSETLKNVTITSGSGSGPGAQGLYLAPVVAAGGSLTLANTVTFSVLAGTESGFFSISPTTDLPLNNAVINDGLISIGAGATFLGSDGSIAKFTNAGSIALGASSAWVASSGGLTGALFTNAAGANLSLAGDATFATNGGGMVNAGTITLAAGAVLTVQGAFSETGTVTTATGASFDIDGATTLASLAGIGGAGTLGIDGLLNLSGGVFDMAASGRIANVQIGGDLANGTFANDAGTVTFGSLATLSAMTWKGALSIGGGSTVDVLNGLTVQTLAGGLPGAIDLAGSAAGGAGLDFLATATLDNVTLIASSASAGLADMLDLGAASGTLTFGAHVVLNAAGGATEFADTASPGPANGVLVNDGQINLTSGALWLDASFARFTNNGAITLSDNTEFDPTPGSAGSTSFTNTGTVTLVSLDDFDVAGSGTNSGTLSIGAGSEVTFGGTFANTGSITMANGASLTITGTMTNGGFIGAAGASSDFVAAAAGAGSAFNAGTLTGGTWSVSGNSTLTLEFGGALTTDAAVIDLNGPGAVLRSVGATIERIESSLATIASGGTLGLLGGRGYATSLALTDKGEIALQGGTLSTGGLTVASAALLTGSGTVSGAISNAGTLDASGGTLTLSGAVSGAGILQIEAGAVLEIGAANAETVLYKGAAGELKLDAPSSFTGTLSGFVAGDSLLLVSTAATKAVLSGSAITVTLSGGGTESFHVAGNSATVTLTTGSDGHGDTLITYPSPAGKGGPIGQTPAPLVVAHAPAERAAEVLHLVQPGPGDFAALADFAATRDMFGGLMPDHPFGAIGAGVWLDPWHDAGIAPGAPAMITGRE